MDKYYEERVARLRKRVLANMKDTENVEVEQAEEIKKESVEKTYEEMKITELKDLLAERGLPFKSSDSKAELIEILKIDDAE